MKGVYLPGGRIVEVSSNGWRWNAGWEGTPMFTVVPDPAGRDGSAPASVIDEIVREGARRMLAEALRAEVDAYVAAFAAERDGDGRRQVVRNGYHRSRDVLTSAGTVKVTAPRVNDRRTDPLTGERKRFCSAILPAWARKTPKVTEVLPLLYLHGLSSGDLSGAQPVPRLGRGAVRAGDHEADRDVADEQKAFAGRECLASTTCTCGRTAST